LQQQFRQIAQDLYAKFEGTPTAATASGKRGLKGIFDKKANG
jgi:hypothetical protein